jgi:predicted extracellular nuclease
LTGNTDPLVVGADGFFIFCSNRDAFEAAYPSRTCDWNIGANGAADSNGDDQIALVFADSSTITADAFTIYDIFGVPGQDGTGKVREFENGLAIRNEPLPSTPSASWDLSQWTVAEADTVDITPRQLGTTGTSPPTPSCATDGPCTSIEIIQGEENIFDVTACPAFVTAVVSDGFYLQQSVGTDDTKSDAIFVFTNDPIPAVGDFLVVCGTINEFNDWTQLKDVTWVIVDDTLFGQVPLGYTKLELCSANFEPLEISMLVDVVPASPETSIMS